jgi:hypothetical protein
MLFDREEQELPKRSFPWRLQWTAKAPSGISVAWSSAGLKLRSSGRRHELNDGDVPVDEERYTIPFDPNLLAKKGFIHRPGLGQMDLEHAKHCCTRLSKRVNGWTRSLKEKLSLSMRSPNEKTSLNDMCGASRSWLSCRRELSAPS